MITNKDIKWGEIENLVKQEQDCLQNVILISSDASPSSQKFQQELAEQNKKNWLIRIVFQASDRTLTEEGITRFMD